MNDQQKHPHDHESDPAHNDQVGSDWSDEGGATKIGPATHESAAHEVLESDGTGNERGGSNN